MADSTLLYENWKNERILFEMIFLKLRKRISVKATHDIRVCVKKMKAYRKLFYKLHDDIESKLKFTDTEKLFDTTGRLRNIHICISLLAAYESEIKIHFNEFRLYLTQNKKQAGNLVKQSLKDYQAKDLEAFELLLMNHKSSKLDKQVKLIRKETDKELNNLTKLTEHPHRVRILLKRIYYWLKMLPPDISARYYNTELINDVLDRLGEWQDNEVLLSEIKFFWKRTLPGSFEESNALKTLQKKINGNKADLKKNSLNKLNLLRIGK